MSRVAEIFASTRGAGEFAVAYLDYLKQVLDRLDPAAIEQTSDLLVAAQRTGGDVYLLGNGGSAATASHIANDLAFATRAAAQPLRVHCLTDNIAVLSSIANDVGYEEVFSAQLRGRLRPGDLVIAISASGASENVLRAVTLARAEGATTVGFTGFGGGALRDLVDVAVHVPTEEGDYGPVEDAHLVLDHILGNYLLQSCRAALLQEVRVARGT